jgi:hypothetical protein
MMQDERMELNLVFPWKAGFNKKKAFRQQVGFKFKEETSEVLTWKVALYGAETCTLRKVDQKYI